MPFRTRAALETANRVRQGASRRSWRATIKTCNAAGRPSSIFWAAQPFGTSAQHINNTTAIQRCSSLT
ncbi:hypothetical protein SALB1_0671 [Salinisphaera sp. LB1]|nr:hypothetical protein SALB1_0671 [Salinisphaera sp. LB1]